MVVASTALLVVIRAGPGGERRVPAGADGAEGGRQAGCADGPGARETREQLVVRLGGEDGGDLGLEGVDGREQRTQLGGVALDREGRARRTAARVGHLARKSQAWRESSAGGPRGRSQRPRTTTQGREGAMSQRSRELGRYTRWTMDTR